MANGETTDPFAFLSRTGVSRETAESLGAESKDEDPFEFLTSGQPRFRFVEEEQDLGVRGAFASGVKRGFLEPLTFLRGRPEVEEEVDETSEKVSEFLGSMVGLGINFVPISIGTGLALRGVGLTARLSPRVADFVKFTLAGGLQFAGTSEDVEELPENLALGVAFGGAIEGFFLARAMRGRVAQAGKLLDDGSPIPDVPVPPSTLAKEQTLAPGEGKSLSRMRAELHNLADEDMTYDEVLTTLGESFETTTRLNGVEDLDTFLGFAQERFPNAQVVSRPVIGDKVHQVLIHNPVNPAERLTKKQLGQWRSSGVFDGEEVIYNGQSYRATGKVFGDNIQIQHPYKKHITFAVARSDLSRPIHPRVFSAEGRRQAVLSELATEARSQVGFTIPAASGGGVRRGVVDTREFIEAKNLQEFISQNVDEILEVGGETIEDAAKNYALSRGIKGIVAREGGVTSQIHVFDQGTVSFIREVPRLGIDVDNAVFTAPSQGQRTVLESFVPSWKNSIAGPLRQRGVPEKEIQEFLELHRQNMTNRLEDLMDPEFKSVLNASSVRLSGGCL